MRHLILLLILTACSADSGSTSEEKKTDNSAPPAQDTTNNSVSPGASTSYYVDSENDLKTCNTDTRGYLAYVKATNEFKACLTGGWETVNVRGKDGAAGSSGKDGTSAIANDNTWKDPITGRQWLIGAKIVIANGGTNVESSNVLGCPTGYTLPDATIGAEAGRNGLVAVANRLSGYPAVWTQRDPIQDGYQNSRVRFIDSNGSASSATASAQAGSVSAVLACYKS